MPKKRDAAEHWSPSPEEHDFPAAEHFLSLLVSPQAAQATVRRLRDADGSTYKAKDILRAARLPLLPPADAEVAKELRRVARGEALSPVLLVRGHAGRGAPLIVADGYHRVCASYHLSDDDAVPCRLADLAGAPDGAGEDVTPPAGSSGA